MSTPEEVYLEPVYSQHVLELIRLGHEYCLFAEKADQYTKEELLNFTHKIFPMLYMKGLLIPDIVTDPTESGERFVTEEEWESIFNALRARLEEKDEFWAVDPEISGGNEAVKLSLAENMTDIYQDLKDFIMSYQRHSRAAKELAVAECKEWFANRWGKRIAETANILHYLLFNLKEGSGYEEIF
jgi:hypothetical protein